MSATRTAISKMYVSRSGIRLWSFIFALFVLFWFSISAHAIEFSPVKLVSGFNEPLQAEIEVTGLVNPESPVIVDIASRRDHQRYSIPHQYFTADLSTTLRSEKDGRMLIQLSSTQPVTQENLRFLMIVMSPDVAMLREVVIRIPAATTGLNLKQLKELAHYRRQVALPAVSGAFIEKKIKPVGKLEHIFELLRHNGQHQSANRILAFVSVTDEVTYDPHFSPESIVTVIPETAPVQNKKVPVQPQSVLAETGSDKENRNSTEAQKNETTRPVSASTQLDERMAILTGVDNMLPDHQMTAQGRLPSWMNSTATSTNSLKRLAADIAIHSCSYPRAGSDQMVKMNTRGNMREALPETQIKMPVQTRYVSQNIMNSVILTGNNVIHAVNPSIVGENNA